MSSMEELEITFDRPVPAEEVLMNCCVGTVDIVGSSKIVTKLKKEMVCPFYRTFLDEMSSMIKEFNGVSVKKVGDCVLYYFPKTSETSERHAFEEALECGMRMIESQHILNSKLSQLGLPPVSYRISVDYGLVTLTKLGDHIDDIFASTVNVCSKINRMARPNTMVIGGDLHQIVKSFENYRFSLVSEYQNGLKLQYPVYSTSKK
jgi:class 3 adenylate cyclase